MEALDILEKRIELLNRIIGPIPDACSSNTDKSNDGKSAPSASENLVDSFISANTLLNGAIAGREPVTKAIERADELENYLDPNYIDEQQKVRSKEVYLNAIAPDLHAQFEQLAQIKQLEPTLGAEYFRNIPGECTDKLKQIANDNSEFAQQSELIEESLILAMKRYGEIQSGLMDSLVAMNNRLELVEEKLQQKKRAELEKDLPIPDE